MPLHIAHLPPVRWLPVAIFLITYLLIAVESNRGSYLDRTAAAFCGAVAMVIAGVLTLPAAYRSISWDTIIFLLGIMILVAHFRVSGFFDWVAMRISTLARTPRQLLALLIFTTGILAAFFVNDTVCLMFTPVVLAVTERLELPPAPYVIALATSANIGSVMSVTGNPQNALIGVSAHFSFFGFLAHLAPVSLAGLGLNFLLLGFIFRNQLSRQRLTVLPPAPRGPARGLDRTLLAKCLVAASLAVILWVFNFSFPLVAASVGALILIIGQVKSESIHHNIDWTLLLFFASLFVVIQGLQVSGAVARLVKEFEPMLAGGTAARFFGLSGAMLALSNLVSNVPAVLIFEPIIKTLSGQHFAWLLLASAATLAGNCTPFSSVANLIVLQESNKVVRISYWEFARVGIPVTLVTTLAGIGILALEAHLFPGL
ncbi:MAG: anion transporter [Acidobacteriota bacterium]|nr:anion transporter [Acidobacteriota bacterium]